MLVLGGAPGGRVERIFAATHPGAEEGVRATAQCKNSPVLNWDDLRHLVALHHAGSLARAALLIGVDKATVARRIESLESTLRCPLVERLPSGYRLTDAGRRALEIALAISEHAAELEASVGASVPAASGKVRVTAPAWFCRLVLIPQLPGFRERQPGIELQLLTTNLVLSMPKREADIAVRNLRAPERGLTSRRLGQLASALYASLDYLERRGMPHNRAALARHHLISYHDRVSYVGAFDWLSDGVAPVVFRASDTLALAEACEAGLGLAVLPCLLGDGVRSLRRIRLTEPAGLGEDDSATAEEEIWAVVPREQLRRAAVQATLQWIAALFAQHQQRLAPAAVEPR